MTAPQSPPAGEELRGQLSNLMADPMLQTKLIKLDSKADMLEQGRKFIGQHNGTLDEAMQLVNAYILAEVLKLIGGSELPGLRVSQEQCDGILTYKRQLRKAATARFGGQS